MSSVLLVNQVNFSKDDLEAELIELINLFMEKTETEEKNINFLVQNILQWLSSAQQTYGHYLSSISTSHGNDNHKLPLGGQLQH